MDCLKNCVIIIPAKLCNFNQRQFLSHDVDLNNKGILHYMLWVDVNYRSVLRRSMSVHAVFMVWDVMCHL